MSKSERALVVNLFVLFFILSFLPTAKAQVLVNYLYLEVKDSSENPVKDAMVESLTLYKGNTRTSEYGTASIALSNGEYHSEFTDTLFKISKDGYFPYQDLGTIIQSYRVRVNIELLKIPQTKEEEKSLGDQQRKREFLWAAKTGNAVAVKGFLRTGFSPNLSTDDLRGVSSPKNVPAILFAAASNNVETIKILLKAGAKVRSSEEPLRNILSYYLHANSLFSFYTRLETQKSRSIREYEGGLKLLFEAGADVRGTGRNGETTVMISAQKGYAPFVKFFLDKGISVNAADNYGYTALWHAMRIGYEPSFLPPDAIRLSAVEMVNFLLKNGADPNIVIRRGENCETVLFTASLQGATEVMKALIAGKANVNLTCENGESALSYAVRYKQVEAVRLLIASGADVKGKLGQTALAEARKKADEWQRLADQVKSYQPQANDFHEIVKMLEAAGAK